MRSSLSPLTAELERIDPDLKPNESPRMKPTIDPQTGEWVRKPFAVVEDGLGIPVADRPL